MTRVHEAIVTLATLLRNQPHHADTAAYQRRIEETFDAATAAAIIARAHDASRLTKQEQ